MIKNKQIKSKNKNVKLSTQNKIMAETGSNPSISNLPERSSVYENLIDGKMVLKSSSGVGTRIQKSKKKNKRRLQRKRFDLSQKQNK